MTREESKLEAFFLWDGEKVFYYFCFSFVSFQETVEPVSQNVNRIILLFFNKIIFSLSPRFIADLLEKVRIGCLFHALTETCSTQANTYPSQVFTTRHKSGCQVDVNGMGEL